MTTGFAVQELIKPLAKHGFFERMKAVTPTLERPDWTRFDFQAYSRRFDDYASKYPKVKSCLLTIAGQTVADGIYTVSDYDYPRAQEAKQKCDEFNDRVGMHLLVRKTAYRMVKYGTCFWELDWNPATGLNAHCIPHQEHMRPRYLVNDLVGWDYVVNHITLVQFRLNQVCVFALDPEENDPYGTSLLTGIDYELDSQDRIRKNLHAYLEKQAFASNVLQVGDGQFIPSDDQISTIRSEVKNRKVGEDFVTNYPIGLQVMGAAAIETRMIPDTLKFTDDQVTDALMSPPISKLYNSTEASATVMTDWARACLIQPMQNIIKEVVEKQVYQPMLEDLGFTVSLTPHLSFDPPDVHALEDVQYWQTAINSKIATPQQAAEALGIEYDEAFFAELERKQQEQFQQQQMNVKQGEDAQQEGVKEYHILEFPKKDAHKHD